VFTHDYASYIETLMKNMLTGKNPEILPPPQEFMEIFQELMSPSEGQ